MVRLISLPHIEPSKTTIHSIRVTMFWILFFSPTDVLCSSAVFFIQFPFILCQQNRIPNDNHGHKLSVALKWLSILFIVLSYHFPLWILVICFLFHLSSSFSIFLQKRSTNPDTNKISVSFIQIVHVFLIYSAVIECKEPIEVVSYKIGVCKVSAKGKDCTTIFQKLGFNGKTSVVLCKPRTGRMHQIRVHLQFLGKYCRFIIIKTAKHYLFFLKQHL